jgi:hypothetical protein
MYQRHRRKKSHEEFNNIIDECMPWQNKKCVRKSCRQRSNRGWF